MQHFNSLVYKSFIEKTALSRWPITKRSILRSKKKILVDDDPRRKVYHYIYIKCLSTAFKAKYYGIICSRLWFLCTVSCGLHGGRRPLRRSIAAHFHVRTYHVSRTRKAASAFYSQLYASITISRRSVCIGIFIFLIWLCNIFFFIQYKKVMALHKESVIESGNCNG